MRIPQAIVPGHAWVDVKNLTPLHNDNGTFTFGGNCSIAQGGSLAVVGVPDAERYLVVYTAPGPSGGAQCPTGVLFFSCAGGL